MAYTFNHKTKNWDGPFSLSVDADLDNMSMRVKELPPVSVGVSSLPTLRFDPINSNVNITHIPKVILEADTTSTLDVAIKEIPDTRAHVPSHYSLGVSIFGVEILNFSLCGESQVITEKYVPRRMEICR